MEVVGVAAVMEQDYAIIGAVDSVTTAAVASETTAVVASEAEAEASATDPVGVEEVLAAAATTSK